MSEMETEVYVPDRCRCGALLMMVGNASFSTCSEFCGAKNRAPLTKKVKKYNNSVVACNVQPVRNEGSDFTFDGDRLWTKVSKVGRELKPGDEKKLKPNQRYGSNGGGIFIYQLKEEQ